MGMGFKLNVKWGTPVQSPFLSSSSSWPSSHSCRGRETSYDSARVSWQSENLYNDPLKAPRCSSGLQTLESDYSNMEEIKMPAGEDKLSFLASLQASKPSRFGLLMRNLDMLEATFADSDVRRLERDILVQLERLGALKLFHTCLSRTLNSPTLSDTPIHLIKEPQMNGMVDVHMDKIIVRSGKNEKRKSRSERASEKASELALPSKSIRKDFQRSAFSSAKRPSNSRSRRLIIARNEAEMSRGVKLVENLERIRTILEEETGRIASLSSWAEAAGVGEKVLQQHLHFGWYCRDELLKSARSQVVYLARNYRGLGVGLEDLVQLSHIQAKVQKFISPNNSQAGNFGVLQGAVRFDHTRGYRFSTYVQYWIRKSMSTLVAQHSRGIRIPFTLSQAINQIQKARKALKSIQGKYPDDDDIAKFTGLSLAKITSASKCLRVVGSIDRKIGDSSSAKFLEFTPDTSIEITEETVMRQHMIKDIDDLLNTLDRRERQVLVLRFGLGDHQRKSLEEIGRLFCVSKEWIRKIERTALTKLRDEESCRNLSHYLHL